MENKYRELLETINKVSCIAELFPSTFAIHCPSFPREGHTFTPLELAILLFTRHVSRNLYFAKNFTNKLLVVVEKSKKFKNGTNVGFPIDDRLYFDFDAFLFSARSLLDIEMAEKIKRGINRETNKQLNAELRKRFYGITTETLNNFIQLIKKYRNEVTHSKQFGSAFGSMANKLPSGEILIQTDFTDNEGKMENLANVFIKVFDDLVPIVLDIFNLFRDYYTTKYGEPSKPDIKYNCGGVVIDISIDFKKQVFS